MSECKTAQFSSFHLHSHPPTSARNTNSSCRTLLPKLCPLSPTCWQTAFSGGARGFCFPCFPPSTPLLSPQRFFAQCATVGGTGLLGGRRVARFVLKYVEYGARERRFEKGGADFAQHTLVIPGRAFNQTRGADRCRKTHENRVVGGSVVEQHPDHRRHFHHLSS